MELRPRTRSRQEAQSPQQPERAPVNPGSPYPESNLWAERSSSDLDESTEPSFSEPDVSVGPPISEPDLPAQQSVSEPDPFPVEQSVSEADTLPVEFTQETKRTCFSKIWNHFRDFRLMVLLSWILTWVSLLLFFLAVYYDAWRLISVNREALLQMAEEGKIDVALLNETISMSRTQGIFKECFVISPTQSDLTDSQADFFAKSKCHDIEPRTIPESPMDNFQLILGNIQIQKNLGTAIYVISSMTVMLEAFVEFGSDLDKMFLMINAGLRTVIAFISIIFLTCSITLSNHFSEDDPAFPVPWPSAIREVTTISVWQTGPIHWIVGVLFQVVCLLLDLKRTQ